MSQNPFIAALDVLLTKDLQYSAMLVDAVRFEEDLSNFLLKNSAFGFMRGLRPV